MGKPSVSAGFAGEVYDAFRFYREGKKRFSELVDFMDSDRDNDLLQAMKEIDQRDFPGKYVSTGGGEGK